MWSFEFPDGHVEKYKKEDDYLKRRAELYGQRLYPVMTDYKDHYYVQDCRQAHENGEKKWRAMFRNEHTFIKGKTYSLAEITEKAKALGYEGEKLTKWLEVTSTWEKVPYKKFWTAKADI